MSTPKESFNKDGKVKTVLPSLKWKNLVASYMEGNQTKSSLHK